jgi:hypothetical protein
MGIRTDRPDATGAAVALACGQQDPQRFFNTAAFSVDPFGMLGNVGRNILIGPGIITFDFSVLKDFSIPERHTLEFRFEAFNLPNHPNGGIPNTNILSLAFGNITSPAFDMREVQFALKDIF